MAESTQIDSFKELLNEINHELTEENLQSLIHLCDLPGGVQNRIKNGLGLFEHLIHEGKIDAGNVRYLRDLLRKMRPRRRELVHRVDDYIKEKYHVDDVSLVLGELDKSRERINEETRQFIIPNYNSATQNCNTDCGCCFARCSCGCRKMPSWCAPFFVVLIIFGIVITCVFWYASVPHITERINRNKHLKDAGRYIIIVELLVLALLVFILCWRYCRNKKRIWRSPVLQTTAECSSAAASNYSPAASSFTLPVEADELPAIEESLVQTYLNSSNL